MAKRKPTKAPKPKPQPKRTGRPPKIVADERTLATITGLAQIQCTQDEAAAVLGVARQTFEAFLAREPAAREAWDNGVLKGRASVRRAQFKLMEAGNATMAIWLGKQLLGQRDTVEHTGKDGKDLIPVINITVGDERKAYSGSDGGA